MKLVESIIGFIFAQMMKPAIKKAEKMFDEDEEFKENHKKIREHNHELEKSLKNYCKYFPDEYECRRRARK